MLPSAFRQASRAVKRKLKEPKIESLDNKSNLSPAAERVRKALDKTLKKNRKDVGKFQRFLDRGLPDDGGAQALQGRTNLLWRVRRVISHRFGPSFHVDTFGSSSYGAASAKSDMDLIILDRSRPLGFDPMNETKLSKIYHLGTLAGVLRKGGFIRVKAIPATVPIIKFEDPKTEIKCDINVNEQPGYWNTIMIQRYAEQSPHFVPLLKAIKLWAKPLGLNTPSPGIPGAPVTFSSYAYALMTIAFMQRQRLLPNLQDNLNDIKSHQFWNRKPRWLCDLRFHSKFPPLPRNDEVVLLKLLGDWFQFWSDFDPARQVVDIRLGGILSRASEPLESEPMELQTKLQSQMEVDEMLQGTGVSEFIDSQECRDRDLDEYDGPRVSDESLEPFRPPRDQPYDPKALQRWEFETFCLIDPFILIRNVAKNISTGVFEYFQAECRQVGAELGRRQCDQEDLAM